MAPPIGTRRTMALRSEVSNTQTSNSAAPSSSSSPQPQLQRLVSQSLGYQPLNVLNVVLGNKVILPSYRSHYREELVSGIPVDKLYVCQRCFRYTKEVVLFLAHKRFCEFKETIPGRLVYDEDEYGLYEVDGEEHVLFAQNISLFCKLFIESKSVCFDVQGFHYYLLVAKTQPAPQQNGSSTPKASPKKAQTSPHPIPNGTTFKVPVTPDAKRRKPNPNSHLQESPVASRRPELQDDKPQIIGFFSKEKMSWNNENLACILVFPPWQKLGLGQLLMSASYELARHEGRLGGPERPLSALGEKSYKSFWSARIARALLAPASTITLTSSTNGHSKSKASRKVSIHELSEATFIAPNDIVDTLKEMRIIAGEQSVLGSPRKKDGAVRLEKGALKEWCRARGIAVPGSSSRSLPITGLKGEFYNLTDPENSDTSSEEEESMEEDEA